MKTWTYTMEFHEPLSTFSGHAVAGLLDRKVMRNQAGLPCILGSSIKGRWRFIADRLLAVAPEDSGLSRHTGTSFCKDPENACTLCRLFGNPALAGVLWIGQAELIPELRNSFADLLTKQSSPVFSPGMEVRPGLALSRVLHSAQPHHLFFDEVLPAGASFSGTLLLRKPLREEEEQFLIRSARCIDRIGGGKARGRGCLHQGLTVRTTA